MKYGICGCGHWGYAPPNFDERTNFLKCSCGRTMYLHHTGDPSEAGYGPTYEIIPIVVKQ